MFWSCYTYLNNLLNFNNKNIIFVKLTSIFYFSKKICDICLRATQTKYYFLVSITKFLKAFEWYILIYGVFIGHYRLLVLSYSNLVGDYLLEFGFISSKTKDKLLLTCIFFCRRLEHFFRLQFALYAVTMNLSACA